MYILFRLGETAMKCKQWERPVLAALALGAFVILPTGVAKAVTATVTLQNGINGYTGTIDRKIDERGNSGPAGITEFDGATRSQMTVDGYAATSQDAQALIRFENLIGNAANQIPANATILDAQLQVVTSTSGNAQSDGPWGVAQLLQPFNSSTTYFGSYTCNGCSLSSRGAWWEDGYSKRPLSAYGQNWQGEVATTDVRAIVQNWAGGEANHGVAIQTGFSITTQPSTITGATTDGWGILATGHPLVDVRPKLTVTYTTDPIELNTFQRGLNGYAADTMAYVQSGTNIYGTTTESDTRKDDITYDGFTGQYTLAANTTITSPVALPDQPGGNGFQQFLDGPQFPADDVTGVANSQDVFALLKFGSVFGAGANQAPTDVPVARAWVALSSGTASGAAISNGEWAIHKVLRNWDSTTLHTDFGTRAGLQVSDGDISEALDTQIGMIYGSEVWFDVTSYLESVRTGATDNGIAVLTTNTADGWQIHLNGSPSPNEALRPRLIVASGNVAIVNPSVPGDYNDNGVVDGADYVLWRNGGPLQNEVDTPGTVNAADYTAWRARFGNTSGGGGGPLGAAVPEPGTWLLLVSAVMAVSSAGRKRV
jgi:hypothetical protein